MQFRIGINLGDVMIEGDDLIGDGVNMAARLQGLAEPGGICISGSVYEQVKSKLVLEWEDLGDQTVKNIAAPVRVYRLRPRLSVAPRASMAGTTSPRFRSSTVVRRMALSVGVLCFAAGVVYWLVLPPLRCTHASIATLPFANLSGDPSQEYFNDGTTEDIISALGRFSDLAVTPYVAVQTYKGKAVRPDEVRRDLGVCYVLTGSIRRSGEQALVTAQLVDALSGRLLWSNKYEGDLKEFSAARNDITLNVVGQLAVKIEDLERRRALKAPTDNLDAYDLVLRGRAAYERNTRSTNDEARRLFEQAIALDPNYASAYAALGNTYVNAAASGWIELMGDAYSTAERLAQKAVGLDKDNAEAHRLLSDVYFYRGQLDIAMNEVNLAVDLNQSDAAGYLRRGDLLVVIGRSKDAISDFEIARSLNPGLVSNPMGWAHYLQRRYREAATLFEEGARLYPNDFTYHAGRAAAYAQLGRNKEATQAVDDVRRTWPYFSVKQFTDTYEDEADRALVAEGLRKAGLR